MPLSLTPPYVIRGYIEGIAGGYPIIAENPSIYWSPSIYMDRTVPDTEIEEIDMVGRETFRNLGERVRNAMNIRRAGGGIRI